MSEEDKKVAYEALSAKQGALENLANYYYGDQPLRYTAERLAEAFDNPTVSFIQNWCAVVIDSVLDRLIFKGWDDTDEDADAVLDKFWEDNYFQKVQYDVHQNALVAGEAYIVFDVIGNELVAFHNDSRLVHLFYDGENPYKKRMGAKWWIDELTGEKRLNLYYDNTIEKYIATKKSDNESGYLLDKIIPNPIGEIPIVHFRTGYIPLKNILTLQDAVNKTLSDMMVVAEFNAFQQRWMVTNAKLTELRNNPRTILRIPKGQEGTEGTQVGTFPAADLDKFLSVMDKLANSIAIISRTPKHYFMDTGSNISGEALIVMESPLVKKAKQIQENYSIGWQDCARMILSANGIEYNKSDVSLIWEALNTNQPLTEANVMKTQKEIGLPIKTILRRAGWGSSEMMQYEEDKQEQDVASKTETQILLDEIRKRYSQNNNPDNLIP